MQKKEQPADPKRTPLQPVKPFTENEPEAAENVHIEADPDVIPDEEMDEPPAYEKPSLGEGP